MTTLALVLAIGSGLIGGVFFAFSTFIMRALGRVPASEGVRAMQAINVTVLTPWFLGIFLGTGVGCGALLALLFVRGRPEGSGVLIGAATTYLVGSILVTIAFNIPRNERLARVEADAPETAALWDGYLREWTFWNHVRTAASVAAAMLFTWWLAT